MKNRTPFIPVLLLASTLVACGGTGAADKVRGDSLLAAADTLEYAGYGALGTGAEIEKYYIEALANCREAERLGVDSQGRIAHLTGNLQSIRAVVESQAKLAEGMPTAAAEFRRRLAAIDSVLAL